MRLNDVYLNKHVIFLGHVTYNCVAVQKQNLKSGELQDHTFKLQGLLGRKVK